MKVELITDLPALYPIFKEWWEIHGWPGVPMVILPKLGILASDAAGPVAAGWLYMDNSIGVCMLEWMVTDPGASPRDAAKGLLSVVEFLKLEAKRLGYGVMLGTCKQPSLSRFLQKRGFEVTDSGMIHHIAIL
jgi:hypothetical protein